MSKATDSDENNTLEPSNNTRPPFKLWLRNLLRNPKKSPVYHITESGVTVRWFDLDNTENLPFDKETYRETQVFIGEDYANPWKINVEAIEKEYSEYSQNEPLNNLISNKHIIPSQKYKTYMNQTVLQDSFYPGGYQWERMKYVLYGILAVSGINLMVALQ